jgi:hypothetical protein
MRKRMLPMASSARSKKRIRPNMKKKPPPLQKATPISGRGGGLALLCFGAQLRDYCYCYAEGDGLCVSESHIVGMMGGEGGCLSARIALVCCVVARRGIGLV